MRVQIFSDLHGDVHPIKRITILPGVRLVIVVGDTCEGAIGAFEYLRRIVPLHIPIAMVLGNHEYYRRCVPDELGAARSQAASFNIHLLRTRQ
jgi:predicted phosphodiesterase